MIIAEDIQHSSGRSMGYSTFNSYRGVEGRFPGGVSEVFFQGYRSQRLKLAFTRGSGQVFQWGDDS